MQQSYWNLAANLWAVAVSTAIALFLPDFGPSDKMSGGIGVVIRATMAVPVVFTLMYWIGRLISFLSQRWIMNLLMLGIQHGIQNAAEQRAKKIVEERGEEMARQRAEEIIQQRMAEEIARQSATEEIARRVAQETAERVVKEISRRGTEEADAENADKARESEREEIRQFMQSKGVSDEEINAFFHRVSNGT